MRQIDYIFIDSDTQDNNSKSGRRDVSDLRYHFVINSQGLVISTTDIKLTTKLIAGPIYDPDKFNRRSIFIRYCGSLRPEAWLIEPSGTLNFELRKALLQLLVSLRKHFPEAKILGLSELRPKEYEAKNIIVSDAMNVLRRELSDLP